MPTQAAVADAAGVSQQTVSQVLSGTGRISESVRRHVLDVVNRLDYRPNKVALALRNNVHGTIGLIGLGDNNRSFVPNMLMQNLQTSLHRINKHLSLIPVMNDEIKTVKENPAKLGIDGAFLSITKGDVSSMLNIFQSAGIPEIWLNIKMPNNCVYPDDYEGASQVTTFLISQQHTGIGYVGYNRWQDLNSVDWHYSVKDRYMGYKDAMVESGLSPVHLIIGEMTTTSLLEFMRLAQPSPVLLCYELSMALRVLLFARSAGIDVPSRLKIIYFHESPFWDNDLDSLIRCIPVPNDKLAEVAIDMFNSKNGSRTKNARSVAVPYDPYFFKHLLTTRSYIEIMEEKKES